MSPSRTPKAKPSRPDAKVRRALFWSVLGLVLALALGAHWLESSYTYRPYNYVGKNQVFSPYHLRWGSYGFYLADLSKRPGKKTIMALGNSAYEDCGIVERMQVLARKQGMEVDFFNLAQAGAGLFDHMLQLGKVLPHKPDLLIVSTFNHGFTPDDGHQDLVPKFRTDCELMALDPGMLSVVPLSFYQQELNLEELGGAAVSVLFPYKRLDTIIRHRVGNWFHRHKVWPVFSKHFLRFPTINLSVNMLGQRRVKSPRIENNRLFPRSEETLEQFIQVCKEQGVPVLFIRQESGPKYASPEIMPLLEQACATWDRAWYVDFMHHYSAQSFPDQVHPIPPARDAVAQRHFKAVQEALARLAKGGSKESNLTIGEKREGGAGGS